MDNPTVIEGVRKIQLSGRRTQHGVWRSLCFLKECFFQDLPEYLDLNPRMKLFQAPFIRKNEGVFRAWCDYVRSCSLHQGPSRPSIDEARMQKIESAMAECSKAIAGAKFRIDKGLRAIDSHINSTGPDGNRGQKRNSLMDSIDQDSEPVKVCTLRKMRGIRADHGFF